jgi:hypothetical protein
MEYSGFFPSLKVDGVYDRHYTANDYSDNLAAIISNGVRRSAADDLRVTVSGMNVTVAAGRAWIEGHYYKSDTPVVFTAGFAPTAGARWDRVVLRLNKGVAARSVSLVYVKGAAANTPTKPAPTRSGDIYDLVLADIYVSANATTLSLTDTRADASVCGWVYSTAGDNSFFETLDRNFDEWFVEKKDTLATVTQELEYRQETTLSASTKNVTITIPQYREADNQKMAVYVNGLRKYPPTDYTVTGSVITFSGTLVAGTNVSVFLTVAKDGTGIPSIVEDVAALQNEVADLKNGVNASTYTYICNGANDNVKISEIAQAFLNGGDDYSTIRISVFGTFGATAAFAGVGNSTSPFRWFSVGADESKNRRVIVDFSSCGEISLPIAGGTVNTIFHGLNAHIIGASVLCNQTAAGTSVRGFSHTAVTVLAENCRFWITSYQDSRIAYTGTFKNCLGSIANVTGNTYCFQPYDTALLRIYGGEFYAYTGASGSISAIVGQSATNAVAILYGVNAPSVARSGFYQTNSLIQYVNGGVLNCTDLVSELPMTVVSGISNIRGTIAKNKAGVM